MKEMDRRTFIKWSATAAGAAVMPLWIEKVLANPTEAAKWQQFKGETVKVLTENTPPSLGIKAASGQFTKLTGMKAEFTLDAMDALKEKLFLDLRGGSPEYHVNYAQPRPIGCVVCDYWEPVNKFIDINNGKSKMADLPDVPAIDTKDPDGLRKAYLPKHFDSGCVYYDRSKLYGLPYDTAQGIMFFRKDIFAKYGPKYSDKTGKPFKLSVDTTWDDFYQMCLFLKKNCKEVDAPLGLHYAQNWPIASEWASFLTGFGVEKEGFAEIKDYFAGQRDPGPVFSRKEDYEKGLQVLEYLKKLLGVMHPDVMTWGWTGLGTAYATGKLAVMRNCGEFCPYIEDPKASVAAGKTGYEVVPKGPSGINAYEIGAAGLSIPKALPLKEQKKAWLFIMWATGPKAQWEAFTKFYGTPVRTSNLEEARAKGWLKPDSKFRKAQHLMVQETELKDHLPGFNTGPKIPTYSEYLDIVGGELSKWVAGRTPTPKKCLDTMIERVNKLHGH
ncbi:MAG: substrate-binding domain-containing protein [Desulfarculaceae bacterium]|nr:substrate-binding domain-containing protein [Desulfarculaceae bacterium]MCF8073245.1 substrate-binding domain-containing protein [Desulfarculaceae bacterium]MCF8100841.1 substrate-binding domain-containing protein [Desulfarculaceae bacterium]